VRTFLGNRSTSATVGHPPWRANACRSPSSRRDCLGAVLRGGSQGAADEEDQPGTLTVKSRGHSRDWEADYDTVVELCA